MQKNKAQGALEYLLIIGGAVLVAALVIVLVLGASGPTTSNTQQQILNSLCARFSQTDCPTGDPTSACTDSCQWSGNICTGKPATDRSADCF